MTEEAFIQHRTAVHVRKAEKPKKLMDRASMIWGEIGGQQYNYERQQVEIEALDKLTLKEIQEYFEV